MPQAGVSNGRPAGESILIGLRHSSGSKSSGLRSRYEQDIPRTVVYYEHEIEHIQKFSQAGFKAIKAEKDLDEGIPFVRDLLEVKGDPERPGLLVSDRCVELNQEFQSYKEEHVGKTGDVPDHVLDASRYALFTHNHGTSLTRRDARSGVSHR